MLSESWNYLKVTNPLSLQWKPYDGYDYYWNYYYCYVSYWHIHLFVFCCFFNPITPNVYINRIQNKSMREDPLSFTLPDMDTAASFGIIPPQFSIWKHRTSYSVIALSPMLHCSFHYKIHTYIPNLFLENTTINCHNENQYFFFFLRTPLLLFSKGNFSRICPYIFQVWGLEITYLRH